VDRLIAFSQNVPHDEIEREVYFPTLSDKKGDTGVVDLQSLASGQSILFKVPIDQDWLVKYGWIYPYEEGIPYLKSLKLFLPKKDYSGYSFTTTSVTLTSVAGSAASLASPNTGTVYLLPPELNKFLTLYQEGE